MIAGVQYGTPQAWGRNGTGVVIWVLTQVDMSQRVRAYLVARRHDKPLIVGFVVTCWWVTG